MVKRLVCGLGVLIVVAIGWIGLGTLYEEVQNQRIMRCKRNLRDALYEYQRAHDGIAPPDLRCIESMLSARGGIRIRPSAGSSVASYVVTFENGVELEVFYDCSNCCHEPRIAIRTVLE